MIYAYNLHILLYHITSLWQWRSHWPTQVATVCLLVTCPFCSLLLPSQMEILLSIQRTLKVLFNTRHIQWTINCRDKIYSNNMYLLYLFIFRLFSEVLTYKIAHSSLASSRILCDPLHRLNFSSCSDRFLTIVLSGTFVVSFCTCWRSHHPIIVGLFCCWRSHEVFCDVKWMQSHHSFWWIPSLVPWVFPSKKMAGNPVCCQATPPLAHYVCRSSVCTNFSSDG